MTLWFWLETGLIACSNKLELVLQYKNKIMSKEILLVIVSAVVFFALGNVAKAATDPTKAGCDAGKSQRPCYCCSSSITVTDKTYDTASSIDGCNSTKMLGCYQFSDQCRTACSNGGYKSFVLYDTSYSNYGNSYAANRLNNVSNNQMSATANSNTNTNQATSQSASQQSDNIVPGSTDPGGIIQCGRGGQLMCTLCDMIKGFNAIIQYIMKIAIGVALLAIAIGGVMYIISAGSSSQAETAKTTIQNAVIGFVVIFAAYIIVNTTILYLGTKPGMGINAQWGTFDCTANSNR
jgi:hypothetical protein